jgi:DNA-binding IclR family transcriptional regulator
MTEGLVKSAARALDILDVFAARRTGLTATELGAALGYPKSSMSVLLRSLVTQGYLTVSGREQAYFPTLKVARLGDWIAGALIGSERLLDTLEALRAGTGETVTLTGPLDLQMRCLHALIGTHPISLQIEEGTRFPMMGTAVGAAWLSAQPADAAEALVARWAKQEGRSADEVDRIQAAVEAVRRDGFAAAYDAVLPDTGALAMPVATNAEDFLVVAVAGLNSRIRDRETELVSIMRDRLAPFQL